MFRGTLGISRIGSACDLGPHASRTFDYFRVGYTGARHDCAGYLSLDLSIYRRVRRGSLDSPMTTHFRHEAQGR